jgi:hypothetical protein
VISDKYRCIFVHIPRTAGSSIEKAVVGRDWWWVNPLTKHLTTTQARMLYGNKRWGEYFSFSFVRNPWDKLVSMWEGNRYWKQRQRLKTFTNFVREATRNPFEQRTLHYHEILDLTPDNQLSRWQQSVRKRFGPSRVQFIGRFETLEADMQQVFAKIGVPPVALPSINKSKRGHYRDYYDDESIQIVAERFAVDIQLFDYKF